MKFKIIICVALSAMCISATAQIQTTDVQGVCKNRISGYVAGLETAVAADPANRAANAELDRINKLSPSLEPCDKLQQIPALVQSDRAVEHAIESIKAK